MKFLFYASIFIFVVTSCNQTKEKIVKLSESESSEKSVIKPLNFDLGATIFKVDAANGDTIFLENGGSILFDTDCFVDSKGKPVKGKVDIQWQEFHSLAEIAASGIPMKYDSAGVANDFVSGGMFTIKASQKGKPLDMAKGKSAAVNLVSLQDTPCYNFYALDEKTGGWAYETTKSSDVVEEVEQEIVAPEKTILEANLKMDKFPELNQDEIVGWEVKNELSKGIKTWLSQTSTQVRLIDKLGDDLYKIEAKAGKESRSFEAVPYTIKKAQADSKKNHHDVVKAIDEIAKYERENAAGKVVRSIQIAGFGTYNWDIIHQRQNPRMLVAHFSYPKDVNPSLVTLSLISPEENAIVTYDSKKDASFSFDPKMKNCLVGILPTNEIVVVKNSGFNKARNLKNGSDCTFEFKKTGIKLKSPSDLSSYLETLI